MTHRCRHCVEAIVAAQIGDVEKAVRYGMTLVYGFGGMCDDDVTLFFWPRRAPQDNARLGFRVTYRDQLLEVKSRYRERGIYTA